MIETFDPASYPGPRPAGPALLYRGRLLTLGIGGPVEAPLRLEPPGGPAPERLLDLQELRFVLAYGSNASPGRLVAKGLDLHGVLLLPARALDVVPAFEQRRTSYGSVPLTLVPSPGAVTDTWALGLPPRSATLLDRSEGRPPTAPPSVRRRGLSADGVSPRDEPADGVSPRDEPADGHVPPRDAYRLAHVAEVNLADRFLLPQALAYVPGPATRVQTLPDGRWRSWPASRQRDALEHLDRRGPARAVPPLGTVVTGAWPSTPIRDPPLFAVGAFEPGGARWPRIAELVEVLGRATAPGGGGAASPTGRRVEGTLLAARSPAAAHTLLDGPEGRTDASRRPWATAAVVADGRRCWAVVYGVTA